MAMDTKLARIYGLVQGVNYRRAMQAEALRLGLSGWVRNRMDGTVEALLCGSPDAIEIALEWARRGPPVSRVERIEIMDIEAAEGDCFDILPSA